MKKYLMWKGRMNRKEYFISVVVLMLIAMVIIFSVSPFYPPFKVDGDVAESIIAQRLNLYNIISLPFAYLSVCYVIQRFHDMNKSGVHYFWLLVPIVNLYFGFILFFKKGTEGKNNFDIL